MVGLPVAQMIARFREIHTGRVLVCSGHAPRESGLTPEMFDDFLPKPFASEDLVARIRSALR